MKLSESVYKVRTLAEFTSYNFEQTMGIFCGAES